MVLRNISTTKFAIQEKIPTSKYAYFTLFYGLYPEKAYWTIEQKERFTTIQEYSTALADTVLNINIITYIHIVAY